MHKRRRQLALALSALGAFALGRACFVEIAEPVDSTDAGLSNGGVGGGETSATGGQTGGATSGGTGGAGASGGGGGAGGAAGVAGCSVGQVACGNLGCFTTQNDLPTELTEAGVDGGFTWRMPMLADDPVIDADAKDWAGARLVPINDVCTRCTDATRPGNLLGPTIIEFKTRPQAPDLVAYFAAGWTGAGIYVLVVVLDDEMYPPVSDAGADAGALPADQVDGVELFVDGFIENFSTEANEGFGPYAHHFFIGTNGTLLAPSASDMPKPDANYVRASVQRSDNCYLLEAKVYWAYLRSGSSAPQAGDFLRFDIGVNDWDTGDGGTAQREFQVLWRDPGDNYANVTSRYPMLTLE